MTTALLVIAILVFLIVVHELGHFIAAKLSGVRVDEFGIGYPPRAFRFIKLGDTEYTLNWIPFGGFVRLFGEEEEKGRGSFAEAPRWKQALILIAGVAMNAIAAWGLFAGAYSVGVLHPVENSVPGARLIVTDIVPGSPADAAGIKPADHIVEVKDATGSAELTPEGVLDFVSVRAGKEVSVTFVHVNATSTATLRPAHAVVAAESGRPAIGLGLALVTTEALPVKEAIIEGYYATKGTFALVSQGLWKLVTDAFRGAANLADVVGPVGLVSAVGEAADNGWGYVLSLAAFISVNLVIINLFPIPALDGGRLVVVIIESIMRRSAPRIVVQLVNTVGLALIIMLMVTVTYHDVSRLLA